MPSNQPLPTVADLRTAFKNGLVGIQDEFADTITGSMYDVVGSIGAICFSKQAQRDQDLFDTGYFDAATGGDLTDLVLKRYGIARILDTYGQGSVQLQRAPGGVAGTLWTGTRVLVSGGAVVAPMAYVVAADTAVGAGQSLINLPVHAPRFGSGYAISAIAPPYTISISDACFDGTFRCLSIQCLPGTDFEQDQYFKARVRAQRQTNRVGYIAPIVAACIAAGATNVALFPSYFGANSISDYGLNFVYVGDQNYNGTTALANKCMLALEAVRVAGADLQVFPMARTNLSVAATLYMYDSPGKFNQNATVDIASAIMQQYFTGNANAFGFTLSGLAGAVQAAMPEVQKVVFTSPTADISVSSPADTVWHKSGTGPACTVSGVPLAAVLTVEVDVYTSGSASTALFLWKLNGVPVTYSGAANVTANILEFTGLTWNFPAGSYTTKDAYCATNFAPRFPTVLPRYMLAPNSITLTLSGPVPVVINTSLV